MGYVQVVFAKGYEELDDEGIHDDVNYLITIGDTIISQETSNVSYFLLDKEQKK